MAWRVEYTDEFEGWWDTLDGEEQDAIDVVVGLLEEKGPQLSFPQTTKIATSRHSHHVPIADSLYDEHLEALRREGLIDGTQVE